MAAGQAQAELLEQVERLDRALWLREVQVVQLEHLFRERRGVVAVYLVSGFLEQEWSPNLIQATPDVSHALRVGMLAHCRRVRSIGMDRGSLAKNRSHRGRLYFFPAMAERSPGMLEG